MLYLFQSTSVPPSLWDPYNPNDGGRSGIPESPVGWMATNGQLALADYQESETLFGYLCVY